MSAIVSCNYVVSNIYHSATCNVEIRVYIMRIDIKPVTSMAIVCVLVCMCVYVRVFQMC